MNIHDATETAYKNGYKQGKKDALKWISVKDRLPEIPDGWAENPEPVLYMMKSTKTIYAGYTARVVFGEISISDSTMMDMKVWMLTMFFAGYGRRICPNRRKENDYG